MSHSQEENLIMTVTNCIVIFAFAHTVCSIFMYLLGYSIDSCKMHTLITPKF